jgi:hypothetical protein
MAKFNAIKSSISTDRLSNLVAEALLAFGEDPVYSISMMKVAHNIAYKQVYNTAKIELLEAETKALEICSNTLPFVCDNKSPCGTGKCKFTSEEMSQIDVVCKDGNFDRPQEWSTGKYNLDDALLPLVEKRFNRGLTVGIQ